ncbi:hypothetical protein AAA443_11370 [Staphylococcus equorum]
MNINKEFVKNNMKTILDSAKKVISIYENIDRKYKESILQGVKVAQYYSQELDELIQQFKNGTLNIESIIQQQRSKIIEVLEDKIGFEIEELNNFKTLLIEYLKDPEQEVTPKLLAKCVILVNNFKIWEDLKNKLGDQNYNNLIGIVVKTGLEISKVMYQHATNFISSIELEKKITTIYQDYAIAIKDFIKEENIVKDLAVDVVNFAIGNKAAAIIGVVSKISSYTISKFINKEQGVNFNHSFEKIQGVKITLVKQKEKKKREKKMKRINPPLKVNGEALILNKAILDYRQNLDMYKLYQNLNLHIYLYNKEYISQPLLNENQFTMKNYYELIELLSDNDDSLYLRDSKNFYELYKELWKNQDNLKQLKTLCKKILEYELFLYQTIIEESFSKSISIKELIVEKADLYIAIIEELNFNANISKEFKGWLLDYIKEIKLNSEINLYTTKTLRYGTESIKNEFIIISISDFPSINIEDYRKHGENKSYGLRKITQDSKEKYKNILLQPTTIKINTPGTKLNIIEVEAYE